MTALCSGVPATVMPRPRRNSSRPSSRSWRSARKTVFRLTSRTAARSRAGGSRSPGFASPSAITRRISAATCSCRSVGSARSTLTRNMVPVKLASREVTMSILTRARPPRADDPADAEALEALIEEARQRARRRRRGYAASALVAAAIGLLGFYGFNHGGGAGRPQARAEQVPGEAAVLSQLVAGRWRPARGLEGAFISALVVDPMHPKTVFAATLEAGVFKSSDGSRSWRALSIAPTASRVDAVAIAATEPQTVYAGTGDGVFKSTDRGASWQAANAGLFGEETAEERDHRLTEGYVYGLAVDESNPDIVYAATFGRGLFKTTNGGASWRNIGLTALGAVVLDPADPRTIYAGATGAYAGGIWSRSGVFKSTDGGMSWHAVGLQGTNVDRLAIDPENPNIVYAGGEDGLFKSTDGGASWAAAGLHGKTIEGLTLDAQDPETIYAGTYPHGIFKSTDRGRTWRTLKLGQGANALALNPQNAATLYAGTEGGILKSIDAGASWRARSSGLVASRVTTLAIDPRSGGVAYAGIQEQGVFKRTGGTWRAANRGLANLEVWALAVDPQDPENVYAGTGAGGFKTTDGAASWRRVGLPADASVYTLALDPKQQATLYAGTDEGIFKSTKAAGSWHAVNDGLTADIVSALAIDPHHRQTVYAGTDTGLFRSTDGGRSWHSFSRGLPSLSIQALAVDPAGRTVYAGAYGGGIYELTLAK